MKKHPLPQHIASYEFRLVGEMTLKQFGLLGGGLVLAFLSYLSGLPWYFKWPLIIGFSSLGAVFAFIPLNDQPLTRWVIVFFKAIFRPTQFIWQKRTQLPPQAKVTLPEPPEARPLIQKPVAAPTQISEYLASLPRQPKEVSEEKEVKRAAQITGLFQSTPVPTPTKIPAPPPIAAPQPVPQPKPIPRPIKATPSGPPIIPSQKPVVLPEAPGREKKPWVKAKTSPTLPFPRPPSLPNLLVGMALDEKGEIIEGAILEIRDQQGTPVRAMKTNKLGQFRTATPLANGIYEIETEKEGYQFDIIKIKLEGEIVQPIEIKAKASSYAQTN